MNAITYKKPFIIVEIGYNHNGSLEKAKRMVDEISEIPEVDSIKFQVDCPEKIYSSIYGREGFNFFDSIQMSGDDFFELFEYIKSKNKISFLSFSDDDLIDSYVQRGLDLIKISSSSFCNYKVLDPVFKNKIPTIASFGMSNYEDILNVYNEFTKHETPLSLMYCVSMYPTPLENVSMGNIETVKKLIPGVKVGYSDHTRCEEALLAAVLYGADLLEMHIKLDDDTDAIEESVSYTVSELKSIVRKIENIQIVRNPGNDNRVSLNPDVQKARESYFRSLYCDQDLQAGEVLCLENVGFKRPNKGIPSNLWPLVEGKKINKDVRRDEPITWSDIC